MPPSLPLAGLPKHRIHDKWKSTVASRRWINVAFDARTRPSFPTSSFISFDDATSLARLARVFERIRAYAREARDGKQSNFGGFVGKLPFVRVINARKLKSYSVDKILARLFEKAQMSAERNAEYA